MTFDSYVQSITLHKIVPKVVEGAINGNVLPLRLFANGKDWSGETMKRPLMHQLNTSGGSYSGLDTLSTAKVNTRVSFSYDPRQNYQSVVLSNIDLGVNKTQAGVLDLLQVEMETARVSLMDRLGTQVYADGTGNGSKDFLGLKALVDDGTVAATIGGLTRATYPTPLNSTVTSSVGAITRGRMATQFDAASHGTDEPSLIVTDKTTWSYLEALFTPQLRNEYSYISRNKNSFTKEKEGLKGEVGFRAIVFRGTPIVSDEKCTSGYIYFLNEKYLEWRGLKHPTHKDISFNYSTVESGSYNSENPKVTGFSWTGLKEPVNQDGQIGQIFIYGNLVCWSPRHQSVLQGVTS